jgi:hypothetical protein
MLTLALGIGANTAIFTLVQGILLRSLPVSDPAQLYRIGDNGDCCVEGGFPGDASDTGDFTIFSTDLYQYLRDATPEFEQLAAVQAGGWTWSVRRGSAVAKSLQGEFVSGNYFKTLGMGAFLGREFSDQDDTPSSPPVTVISYKTWQGEYASDPVIVGSTIFIQTKPFTVVGVAPPGFFGDRVSDSPPDFWMPLNTEPYVRGDSSILHHQESHWLYLLGRVRKGTNIDSAPMALHASFAHGEWRSGHHSQDARSAYARRRRHTEPSAADRQGPEDADDSVLRGTAYRLRQHCQPAAGAQHRAPR